MVKEKVTLADIVSSVIICGGIFGVLFLNIQSCDAPNFESKPIYQDVNFDGINDRVYLGIKNLTNLSEYKNN